MCQSVVFHESAIFRLIGADDGEYRILQQFGAVDWFSFLRVVLAFLVYDVFWDLKSYLRIDAPPPLGLLPVVVQHLNFISKKPRFLCPCVGNQSFGLGEFQLELLSQEYFQLSLDFLCLRLWAYKSQSGSQEALLPLSPLRTGRVPLRTSGSSTSRTSQLLLLIPFCPSSAFAFICQKLLVVELLTIAQRSFGLRMDVLMAKQMNQRKIAVGIFAPLRPCQQVVNLEFFVIEERFSAFRASPLLPLGKLSFRERQVPGFRRLALFPVVLEFGVIGRCRPLDERMSLYREPAKFEQVASGLFVAKHPGVSPIKVQPAPVFAVPPVFGFVWMRPPAVAVLFVEHPTIQFAKDFFCHSGAKVVGPSTNNRVEPGQNRLDVATLGPVPQVLQLPLYCLD